MSNPRILFACAKTGARSQIAACLFEREMLGTVKVDAAAFDPGGIAKVVREAAAEFGAILPKEPCRSVFELRSDNETFDYVIAISDCAGPELSPLFRTNVEALYQHHSHVMYWDVPDMYEISRVEARATVKLLHSNALALIPILFPRESAKPRNRNPST